ncbi:glutamate--tRNA ligase [Candidatus Pacearchaeota archaeon]|nr:glutamate--tRNA ligase [Candidatus Pacearchaeota archaeon]
MEEELKKKVKAYALKNALAHKGKAQIGAVISALFQEGLKKDNIDSVINDIQKIVDEANKLNAEEQEKQFQGLHEIVKEREAREGLPELENAVEGRVIMRFAPYPSGPLHLGNTRQLLLNDYYAKKHKGKFHLVFDDTIGSEEKPIAKEAYKLIEHGIKWLGAKYSKPVIYKSGRLEIYYKYAEELIKKGNAYACSCSSETLRYNRARGIECACRQYSIAKQLERWKMMFSAREGECTLRLKTSMQHPNPAFRDRVLFRISEREHPRAGYKYKVWPLLDFSWAIDDHLLGITHIIRGKDLMMESEMEKFIWDIFGWEHPVLIHTGLFQIEGAKISKSKGQQEIMAGKYSGWDDPRTWSLQSLEKRGMQPEAIVKFCLSLGLTRGETIVPIDVLYAENRKLLEKSRRLFFVAEPARIKIENAPPMKVKIPLHSEAELESKEKIERTFSTASDFFVSKDDFKQFQYGGDFRLMHLFTFKSKKKPLTNETYLEFVSKEKFESVKQIFLHWLPADKKNEKNLVKASVLMTDGSLIKGLAEENVKLIKTGEAVQFERFGFCRLNGIKKAGNSEEYEFWFAHR